MSISQLTMTKCLIHLFIENQIVNIKQCKMFKNIYITHSDNRGMDIGGFLLPIIKC